MSENDLLAILGFSALCMAWVLLQFGAMRLKTRHFFGGNLMGCGLCSTSKSDDSSSHQCSRQCEQKQHEETQP